MGKNPKAFYWASKFKQKNPQPHQTKTTFTFGVLVT